MSSASHLKALLKPFRQALYDFDEAAVRVALSDVCTDHTVFRLCHPMGDVVGHGAFYETCIAPLQRALPDLERRDHIVISGRSADGPSWVGCCGYYTGTFVAPWLDIPPTGHQAVMRFHEFYRVDAGKVVDAHVLWDIPELMMQASAWPMGPSLGREIHVPGPATQDGLVERDSDTETSDRNCQLVVDMLTNMCRHPAEGGPEVMRLPAFWHPKMNWYGPSGIGTARGIAGFRRWHQMPFLRAMPDRNLDSAGLEPHFFAEGPFVAVTGWPNMRLSLTDDGWLGIAPAGQVITLRSLDFWRVEAALIRENWVLIDLLHMWHQLGVDVLARMREFNGARHLGNIDPRCGLAW